MNAQTFRTRDDTSPDLEKIGGSTDKLSIYREQVGITDVLELGPRASRRKAPNIGIYNRVAIEERTAKRQYIFSALLINTCLLVQVILASALTALGAGNGSHTQITALGAANTVIAALLTFTKGQGLPNRLRQYQCTLRKVREYIEQRERDFAQLDCKLDIDTEVRKIKELYEEARQNDENNDPSTYHAPTGSSTKDNTSPIGGPQSPSNPSVKPSASPAAKLPSQPEDSKEDEPVVSPRPERTNADTPTIRPEDSERWKIAYSVADQLVSERHAW